MTYINFSSEPSFLLPLPPSLFLLPLLLFLLPSSSLFLLPSSFLSSPYFLFFYLSPPLLSTSSTQMFSCTQDVSIFGETSGKTSIVGVTVGKKGHPNRRNEDAILCPTPEGFENGNPIVVADGHISAWTNGHITSSRVTEKPRVKQFAEEVLASSKSYDDVMRIFDKLFGEPSRGDLSGATFGLAMKISPNKLLTIVSGDARVIVRDERGVIIHSVQQEIPDCKSEIIEKDGIIIGFYANQSVKPGVSHRVADAENLCERRNSLIGTLPMKMRIKLHEPIVDWLDSCIALLGEDAKGISDPLDRHCTRVSYKISGVLVEKDVSHRSSDAQSLLRVLCQSSYGTVGYLGDRKQSIKILPWVHIVDINRPIYIAAMSDGLDPVSDDDIVMDHVEMGDIEGLLQMTNFVDDTSIVMVNTNFCSSERSLCSPTPVCGSPVSDASGSRQTTPIRIQDETISIRALKTDDILKSDQVTLRMTEKSDDIESLCVSRDT